MAPAAAPAASTGSGASTFGSKSFVGGNLKKTKNEGSETNFSCFFFGASLKNVVKNQGIIFLLKKRKVERMVGLVGANTSRFFLEASYCLISVER